MDVAVVRSTVPDARATELISTLSVIAVGMNTKKRDLIRQRRPGALLGCLATINI